MAVGVGFSLFTPTGIRSFRFLGFFFFFFFFSILRIFLGGTQLRVKTRSYPYLLALFTLALPAAVNCVTYAHAHFFPLSPTLPRVTF